MEEKEEEEKKSGAASSSSLRWGILRRALLPSSQSPTTATNSADRQYHLANTRKISRKAAGGFNLVSCRPLGNNLAGTWSKVKDLAGPKDVCICYNMPVAAGPQLILIQRMEDCVDLDDFEISNKFDIDTTGLVCSWPSEDVLAHYCINHPNMFRSKRVLELGSGYGLAGLAIAASSEACEVVISDGNPQVVGYIQRSIHVNADVFGSTKVSSMTLHWNQDQFMDALNSFDVIVASDCTFFKEFHESLARTIKSLLKNSETSEAIFLSPKRGNSLDKFLKTIEDFGLHYELVEKYDNLVWDLHQKFLHCDDTSWPNYDKDHCYPLLARITFSSHDRSCQTAL